MSHPTVEYSGIELASEPLRVEAISAWRAIERAPDLLRLIVRAYAPQFEGEGKPLPAGAFNSRYGIDDVAADARSARVERFVKRTIEPTFNNDGSYHIIRHPNDAERIVGVLKTQPGAATEERFAGHVGIAEILVDPEFQGRGYGAALLYAYFNYGANGSDTAPSQGAMLDAFDGSPINEWYKRLGFQPEQSSGELRLGGRQALPTTYYVTGEGITVATITQTLQTQHPALQNHRLELLGR